MHTFFAEKKYGLRSEHHTRRYRGTLIPTPLSRCDISHKRHTPFLSGTAAKNCRISLTGRVGPQGRMGCLRGQKSTRKGTAGL